MLSIAELSKYTVTLVSDTGAKHTFYNFSTNNNLLRQILAKHDCLELFDNEIKPIWDVKMQNDRIIKTKRERKRTYIKEYCHNLIVSGIDADVGLLNDDGSPRGILHYSLTERKQEDMKDLMVMIRLGQEVVTWRDDSRVSHERYTAEQFEKLYTAAANFIFSCRFRSDALEVLLDSYGDDTDKIDSLTWETEIPSDIQSDMDSLLSLMVSDP